MFSKPHPHPVILPKERNQNRAVAKLEWCLHNTCRNQENLSGILAAAHSATFHTAFKVIKWSLVELGLTQLIHLAQKDSGYLSWSWCVHARGCHCSVFFVFAFFGVPPRCFVFPQFMGNHSCNIEKNENCLWRMSKTTESKLAPKGFRSQSKLEKRNNQLKDFNVLHVFVLLPYACHTLITHHSSRLEWETNGVTVRCKEISTEIKSSDILHVPVE